MEGNHPEKLNANYAKYGKSVFISQSGGLRSIGSGAFAPIFVFDTTLRDGEQAPGMHMDPDRKVALALAIERLGADVIEAGFAAASPGEFFGVHAVAAAVKDAAVSSLARARREDIDAASYALTGAAAPRLHVFLPASDLHLTHKLKISRERAIQLAGEMVRYAAARIPEVQFTAEDATRADPAFLAELIRSAALAGARIVNLSDTTGYTTPDEYAALFTGLRMRASEIEEKNILLSCHCHNDLGLAVANTLAAVRAGVGQIECTLAGLGERAGVADLAAVNKALTERADFYGVRTGIKEEEIPAALKLL